MSVNKVPQRAFPQSSHEIFTSKVISFKLLILPLQFKGERMKERLAVYFDAAI